MKKLLVVCRNETGGVLVLIQRGNRHKVYRPTPASLTRLQTFVYRYKRQTEAFFVGDMIGFGLGF